MSFEGKVALITGGSSGIGREAALKFTQKGAKVVVADIDEAGGAETVQMVKDAGGDAFFIKTDVAQEDEIQAMVRRTVEHFGRLDYAFNNAGVTGEIAPTAQSSRENFDHVMAVNVYGVYNCMKYEIPEMLQAGGGAIVNTSSLSGLKGYPGVPAYVASKHAILGLTKTVALEHAKDNIRVNAVCPGIAESGLTRPSLADPEFRAYMEMMTPMGRVAHAREIAGIVTWLCSDEASYTTGTYMIVDGGWDAK